MRSLPAARKQELDRKEAKRHTAVHNAGESVHEEEGRCQVLLKNFAVGVGVIELEMEPMEQPVQHRCEEQTGNGQHEDP